MDFMSMFLLNRVKDDGNIFYMIFFSVCISLITNITKALSDQIQWSVLICQTKSYFVNMTMKENEIFLEGTAKKCYKDASNIVDFYFPEKLQAVNNFIITNQQNNRMQVGEASTNLYASKADCLYICDVQSFLLCNKMKIYCTINTAVNKGSDNETSSIRARIYSSQASVEDINNFLFEITDDMKLRKEEEKLKRQKPLVYTLKSMDKDKQGTNNIFGGISYFNSVEFESTRTFQNMFFNNKQEILGKINFFLNNKKWYYDNGIPYSLGIGLHGEPGTGKTSFIKALANLTKRHIVIISLKEIKTKNQLENVFLSKEAGSFYKKIIVFEDIDCIGDIVMAREYKFNKVKKEENNNKNFAAVSSIEEMCPKEKDKWYDPVTLTLDDILNIFDGIIETPGRIMVLSSNHYDKLDPALTRPGRIDLSLHLSNASRECIAEMYQHFYKKAINQKALAKIPDKFYSPAEVINTYVLHHNKPEKFIERLQQSVKVK